MALFDYRGTRLDQIFSTLDRNPAYRVCIWNPRLDNIQNVVKNEWKGPRYDVSHFVESASISQNQVFENDSNSVSSRATIRVAIDDKDGLVQGNTRIKIDQKLFSDGTPIVIYEGDNRIAKDDWIPVFTGIIRGYPGADTAKRGSKRAVQIQAFGRAQAYQRQNIVGINWPKGTDYGTMAVDIAMEELRLTREEILFGEFGDTTLHLANALAQVDKMKGLYEVMRVVDRKPYFDSRGLLVSHDTSFDKPPAFYFSETMISSMVRSQFADQLYNSVSVVGLDHNLSEVQSPIQGLVEVDATVGFFDNGYSETIYWSEDQTKRAKTDSLSVTVLTKNGFGGSASIAAIDEFSAVLSIDTGYAPAILATITVLYLNTEMLAAQLEAAQAGTISLTIFGVGIAAIPLAFLLFLTRIAATALLITIMVIFTRMTRWKVRISGIPFENVHQELKAIAVKKGTKAADTKEREETIHFISDIEKLKTKAKTLLRRESVKSHSYKITMPSNPLIEIDDIIEIEAPNYGFDRPSRFYVTEIQRNMRRDTNTGQMIVTALFCGQDMP